MPRSLFAMSVAKALMEGGMSASIDFAKATLYVEGKGMKATVYRTPTKGTAADLAQAIEVLNRAGFIARMGDDRVNVRPRA